MVPSVPGPPQPTPHVQRLSRVGTRRRRHIASLFVGLVIIDYDDEVVEVSATSPAIKDLTNLEDESMVIGMTGEAIGFLMSIIVGIFVHSLKSLNEGVDINDVRF